MKILAIALELLQSRSKATEDGMRRLGPNSALGMHISTEMDPQIRAARAVVVVDNGFEYSDVGEPSSPLDGALTAHRDVKQGFA